MHVVWNGFGQGRDAVYRAFLSSEGESARAMVHTMSDATKIKIGGVRPKKKRSECARHQSEAEQDDADPCLPPAIPDY